MSVGADLKLPYFLCALARFRSTVKAALYILFHQDFLSCACRKLEPSCAVAKFTVWDKNNNYIKDRSNNSTLCFLANLCRLGCSSIAIVMTLYQHITHWWEPAHSSCVDNSIKVNNGYAMS